MGREPGAPLGSMFRRASVARSSGGCPASHTRPAEIRAGDQRASRQMALRMRKKSMCRRPTSNGSVTLMKPGSHVTIRAVQAASGMWTAGRVTAGAIRVATFPAAAPIPRSPRPFGSRGGSLALPDPAERRLGSWLRLRCVGRRQMLAVAPGAARALLMVLLPARNADHVSIVRRRPGIASR